MRKTIEISDEQYKDWEKGEPIIKEVKKWNPPKGEYFIDSSGCIQPMQCLRTPFPNFGMEYLTRKSATRARNFMRPHHRLVAYAMGYWPDYEPMKWRHAYYPRCIADGYAWDVAFDTTVRNPWMPYGPRDKVEELVAKLNNKEVQL